jgi:hypothetical protein
MSLFRSKTPKTSPLPKRRFRPRLESLEGRAVPSATGFSSATQNQFGQQVVFSVTRDGSLWENNPAFGGSGWAELAVPANFLSVSATRNSLGQPVVFTGLSNGAIWENNPAFGGNGWLEIADPQGFEGGIEHILATAKISATQTATGQPSVFAVTQDGSLWDFHQDAISSFSNGWVKISNPAGFQDINATRNANGQAVVFAIAASANSARSLWEFNPAFGGTQWALLSDQGNFLGHLAATQNSANQPVVFAVDGIRSLWEFNPAFPAINGSQWHLLSNQGQFTGDVAASRNRSGQEVVFALDGIRSLWEFNPAFPAIEGSQWHLLSNQGQFTGTLCATENTSGDEVVFAVDGINRLWEYNLQFTDTTGHWHNVSNGTQTYR